ncbi:DUF4174 domain-containing protein [Sphingomonas sp. BAUL-RG-20F-R05-02]|uniref:DUF4174 domain-containing protein n=1 Tax=Sphingomonas sp. BAUL-RG-20F-R05-02 TaxID=2914830 RepID=UPI001F573EA9|nr:DUF4174 domain-containing protein [Sphingomonas sp. BAUL-RG-20F-R05-02]
MITLKLLMTMSLMAASPASLSSMKWEKRVLLVSAPDANDPSLNEQRRIIARWRAGAEERDIKIVEVIGHDVVGASDPAATLRQRYRLPIAGFAVTLIGKDGGSKLRGTRPISAATLEEVIDAMPMRRGGKR